MKNKNTTPNIGIITFHASHNCGSFMQSYALQNILKKHGYSNEIINFSNAGQQNLYKTSFKNNSLKNIIKNLVLLPHQKILKNTYNNYSNFISENLTLSEKNFSTGQELKEYSFPYDTFISGSDQIWNITIADSDDAYFLNFAKPDQKKIAYAPSFGSKRIEKYTNEKEIKKYQQLIESYNHISIREKNGQKWLKELINQEVPVVLDPTLLLEQSDYQNLERSYDTKINKPYIFYYSPDYDPKINQLVKKIAKKYHLQVVAWNSRSFYLKRMNFSSFYLPKTQNPGVYLSLIKNAELVITTSFHGTIFSTIYRKKFWTIKNGGMFGDDDRVKTLIKQLGIEEQLIPIQFDDDFDYLQATDYHQYDHNLPILQSKSKDFLFGAING